MKSKNFVQEIARERIEILFEQAEKEFSKHPERSKRYVELARKISERNRTKIPAKLKEKYCKKCGAFLVTGKNAKKKAKGKVFVIKCLECKANRKHGFKKI